jgi:hypothetical protein
MIVVASQVRRLTCSVRLVAGLRVGLSFAGDRVIPAG